jgi:hypothetical protein
MIAVAEGSLIRETPGRAESSPDQAGACQHYRMVRVRRAWDKGGRKEPVCKAPQERAPARNPVDLGWIAVRTHHEHVVVGNSLVDGFGV